MAKRHPISTCRVIPEASEDDYEDAIPPFEDLVADLEIA
jgi:hypothetical protein